jgi:hypothetical protein
MTEVLGAALNSYGNKIKREISKKIDTKVGELPPAVASACRRSRSRSRC